MAAVECQKSFIYIQIEKAHSKRPLQTPTQPSALVIYTIRHYSSSTIYIKSFSCTRAELYALNAPPVPSLHHHILAHNPRASTHRNRACSVSSNSLKLIIFAYFLIKQQRCWNYNKNEQVLPPDFHRETTVEWTKILVDITSCMSLRKDVSWSLHLWL